MTVFRRRTGDERGLTLIEVMASLLIFGLMTVGLVPLFISSVRGAGMSRTYTLGKNLAVQAMERVRGLPYFISYATQNKAVDILDLYFPVASGAGYNAAAGTYTTVCTSTAPQGPICPGGLPAGYSIRYVARFVNASNTPVEQYTSVATGDLTGYAWNGMDTPPSRILQMTVTALWTYGGRSREHSITSLIGDRRILADKVAGNARIDYVVQVLASYVHESTVSDLKFRAGAAEARVESRLLSTAAIEVSAGDARLTTPSTIEGGEAVELDRFVGARDILTAPPNVDAAPAKSEVIQSLVHPQLGHVAGFASTNTTGVKARVTNENPESSGTFGWNTDTEGSTDAWVNNQATFGTGTRLLLNNAPLSFSDSSPAIFNLTKRTGTPLYGTVDAFTGALGTADRRVRTIARGGFGQLNLFPVSFIGGSNPSTRAVIRIQNFDSNVTCDSTATSAAAATATYGATLRYWSVDSWSPTNPHGTLASLGGSYKTVAPPDGIQPGLKGTNPSDPLSQIGPESARNPLVWKDPAGTATLGSPLDIYLYPITHTHTDLITHNHPGYLSPTAPWASAFNLSASTEKTTNGRNTSAQIGGAIRITTVPLNPDIPQSGLNITVGNLACDASDLR